MAQSEARYENHCKKRIMRDNENDVIIYSAITATALNRNM